MARCGECHDLRAEDKPELAKMPDERRRRLHVGPFMKLIRCEDCETKRKRSAQKKRREQRWRHWQ